MAFVVANIKWIMLVSGLLTCSMITALFAPHDAMLSIFGEHLEGPAAELVVRNWGALIALSGAILVYGAFRPPVRSLALTFAGAGKIVFLALVLAQGDRFLSHQAGFAVAADSLMVVLYAAYLVGRPRS